MPPSQLVVRPIRGDDNLKALSLGTAEAAPLKTFLRKQACDFDRCLLARTHVLVENPNAGDRIWGYITLVASDVETTEQNQPDDAKWPAHFRLPAIKLARMAIDSQLKNQGWGRILIGWTLALVKEHIACRVGCRLVVTDAKQSAIGFYEKVGFTMLDTPANRKQAAPLMFVNIAKI